MNIFQESCSISAVLLLFLLQGSRAADEPDVHVHKAVGDSLDLIANYTKEGLDVKWKYNGNIFAEYEKDQIKRMDPPLFNERLKMYKDNISITIKDLQLQDSGSFSIVAENKTHQFTTKFFVLHVHDRIRDVRIEQTDSWLESKNMCVFHLRCLASGDLNPSYSWSGDLAKTRQNQSISLHPAESATVSCTANNTVSFKTTTTTVVCTGNDSSPPSGGGEWVFDQKYLLIAVGVGIVAVVIFAGSLAMFCRRRKSTGQNESEGGITVYEDVNTDGIAKKRPESGNGMSIYETVDDLKITKDMPQTLYDKINFQRHPAAVNNSSTPYQEVLPDQR